MPSYQYYFVVLARQPVRYEYIEKKLDSIRLRSPRDSAPAPALYRIAPTQPNVRPNLPSHSLFWTTIAYVLWDDLDPNLLDLDQQKAMLDWLHWGGQLILSGPDTLDTLRASFLAPYLPATSSGTRELTPSELGELSLWSGRSHTAPSSTRPWSAVRLQKHPAAGYVPRTGEMPRRTVRRAGPNRCLGVSA